MTFSIVNDIIDQGVCLYGKSGTMECTIPYTCVSNTGLQFTREVDLGMQRVPYTHQQVNLISIPTHSAISWRRKKNLVKHHKEEVIDMQVQLLMKLNPV